jgi:hypothetical protein
MAMNGYRILVPVAVLLAPLIGAALARRAGTLRPFDPLSADRLSVDAAPAASSPLDESVRETLAGLTSAVAARLPLTSPAGLAHDAVPIPVGHGVDVLSTYESAFARDPIDFDARRFEQAAAVAVKAALPAGSRLLSVECRVAMCRIETAHTDEARLRQFSSSLVSASEARSELRGRPTFVQRTNPDAPPDAEETFVLFVARKGHELPQLD